MKKIFAFAAAFVMLFAMAVGAGAMFSFDRLFVNEYALATGADRKEEDPLSIQPGDKVYILGWSTIPGGLKEIVYTVDGGDPRQVEDNYRARPDLTVAPYNAENNGEHAGFGTDERAMELTGIDLLPDGTYSISVIAVSENGTTETLKTFDLKVGSGEGTGNNAGTGNDTGNGNNPTTSDAAIISLLALSCVSAAGLAFAKKMR